MIKKGILYIATGDRFRNEALFSATRVRELMPEIPIALASDKLADESIFSYKIPIDRPHGSFADKIIPLSLSPFEETIFLDTDTYLCGEVFELFDLLKNYDIAMAHAPMRQTGLADVPPSFPEFNSGVIVYRMNDRTRALLNKWIQFYEDQVSKTGQIDDQPALRRALWHSDAKIAVLPPEYNFRFILPAFAGRGKVKILHGRDSDMEGLNERINRSGSPRIFLPRLRDLSPKRFQVLSRVGSSWNYMSYAIGILSKYLGILADALKARFAK